MPATPAAALVVGAGAWDLRSKVRLRHTLVDQRGEWQQRIRAVLYQHGLPHRSELHLLSSEGRAWLAEVEVRTLPASRSLSLSR